MKVKEIATKCLFKIYYSYIVRKEKYVAALMWKKGVREAVKMYKEIGAPRVYLLYDRKHGVWAPMTYEPNKKYMPALRTFRRMGKIGGVSSIRSPKDMKEACFYYTPSKWGALGCDEDNRVRTEKLAKWMDYYLTRLSEPMRKVRDYQQRHL